MALPPLPTLATAQNELYEKKYNFLGLQGRVWSLGHGLFLLPSTLGPEAGLGVFTVAPIPKDSIITHYEGVVLPYKTVSSLGEGDERIKSHARALLAMNWTILANWRLDPAAKRGISYIQDPINELPYRYGIGGYLNDARSEERNNTTFQELFELRQEETSMALTLSGRDRSIFIRALRDIPAGSELFASYGKDYWTSRNLPATADKNEPAPKKKGGFFGRKF